MEVLVRALATVAAWLFDLPLLQVQLFTSLQAEMEASLPGVLAKTLNKTMNQLQRIDEDEVRNGCRRHRGEAGVDLPPNFHPEVNSEPDWKLPPPHMGRLGIQGLGSGPGFVLGTVRTGLFSPSPIK